MRRPWKSVALAATLSAVGCSEPLPFPSFTAPTTVQTPSPSPSTPTETPKPANPSSAAVTVEDAFTIVHPMGSIFGYEVRFLIRETGGKSGATINQITVYGPDSSDITNAGCWRDAQRVAPLGKLDTFYTDLGSKWLAYCGPGSAGKTPSPSLDVTLTFTDDAGVVGSISFPITAVR